jgi:hypothetical protein
MKKWAIEGYRISRAPEKWKAIVIASQKLGAHGMTRPAFSGFLHRMCLVSAP